MNDFASKNYPVFDLFNNQWGLATAGTLEDYNTCTIAWGSLGNTSERVRERQADILERLSKFRNKLYKIGEQGYHPLTPAVRNGWELVPYEIEEVNHAESNES